MVLGRRQITLWGQDWLEDTLCGLTFRISVPSFYQVNQAPTEVLYAKAAEFAALTGRETVLDLYCGIGTISLVMARTAGRVIGAEIVPAAVADAEANARRNGIRNANFSAPTPPTPPAVWRRRACALTWCVWTRPGRAWPPAWWRPSPAWRRTV